MKFMTAISVAVLGFTTQHTLAYPAPEPLPFAQAQVANPCPAAGGTCFMGHECPDGYRPRWYEELCDILSQRCCVAIEESGKKGDPV